MPAQNQTCRPWRRRHPAICTRWAAVAYVVIHERAAIKKTVAYTDWRTRADAWSTPGACCLPEGSRTLHMFVMSDLDMSGKSELQLARSGHSTADPHRSNLSKCSWRRLRPGLALVPSLHRRFRKHTALRSPAPAVNPLEEDIREEVESNRQEPISKYHPLPDILMLNWAGWIFFSPTGETKGPRDRVLRTPSYLVFEC